MEIRAGDGDVSAASEARSPAASSAVPEESEPLAPLGASLRPVPEPPASPEERRRIAFEIAIVLALSTGPWLAKAACVLATGTSPLPEWHAPVQASAFYGALSLALTVPVVVAMLRSGRPRAEVGLTAPRWTDFPLALLVFLNLTVWSHCVIEVGTGLVPRSHWGGQGFLRPLDVREALSYVAAWTTYGTTDALLFGAYLPSRWRRRGGGFALPLAMAAIITAATYVTDGLVSAAHGVASVLVSAIAFRLTARLWPIVLAIAASSLWSALTWLP